MTVEQLGRILMDLPGDMPVEVYSGSVEAMVNYSCQVITDDDDFDDYFDRPTFVIFAEN